MRSKIKTVPIAMAILGILGTFTFISTSDVYASAIQNHSAAVIFVAKCATCHNISGLGGVTWIKNDPGDKWVAPQIAGLSISMIKSKVRNGANNGRMPAFGPEEITDSELNNLAVLLNSNPGGVPALSAPVGTPVILNILDADPWYQVGPTFSGLPRVALGATDYLKIYNTGRTWHTFTDSSTTTTGTPKDSGFIGYAGNYKDAPGDLGDMGYYYADQTTGLKTGCNRYLCKIHPYMQVEVCTNGYTPKGVGDIGLTAYPAGTSGEPAAPWVGLTRAHKHPIGLPPDAGVGEVWSPLQSQEEIGEDTTTVVNKSVAGFDGSFEVIDATTWSVVKRIPNLGNNPHNAWPGKDSAGNKVVISANWHDNTVTLTDANGAPATYASLYTRRSGADNAHIMVTPGAAERFYTTHMGGRALQQIDADALRLGNNPNVIAGHIRGATGPHGIWMCDDGVHVLTADTFGNSATLFNTALKLRKTASSGGKAPLAPAIMSGFQGGCRRGFTNNALTADVSVYDMRTPVTPASGGISHLTSWPDNPAAHLYKNAAGNIALRDQGISQQDGPNNPITLAPSSVFMARWANLPIQTPVSPANGTTANQYMVTANKASFNVQVTKLDSATGLPIAFYTFPAGLGAHGVNFGVKATTTGAGACALSTAGGKACYYAYVPNTFEDYLSVYDLEKIEGGMGAPGSALLAERAYVEGGAISAVAALDPAVAGLCDAFGGTLLQCGVGPTGGFYVANLPIGVVCPDCRDGVHVGDVPLDVASGAGAPLAGPAGPQVGPCVASALDPLFPTLPVCPPVVNSGAASKYTYVKDEVYVDTATIACVLDVLYGAGGTINNCNSSTGDDAAGTLNLLVSMDLSLGINTGGQGIMPRDPVTGSAPPPPWP